MLDQSMRQNNAGLVVVQASDAHQLEHVLLVDRLGIALLHLADEILLEADLGQVHPLAFLEPADIARRNLRNGDEGGAVVTKVGQADGVPGCLLLR